MKGFIIVCVLAALLFAFKWAYARMAAKKDPVDLAALKQIEFPAPDGDG